MTALRVLLMWFVFWTWVALASGLIFDTLTAMDVVHAFGAAFLAWAAGQVGNTPDGTKGRSASAAASGVSASATPFDAVREPGVGLGPSHRAPGPFLIPEESRAPRAFGAPEAVIGVQRALPWRRRRRRRRQRWRGSPR